MSKDARACIEWLNAVRAMDAMTMEDRVVALMPRCPSEHAITQLRQSIRTVMAASVPIPPDPNETKE